MAILTFLVAQAIVCIGFLILPLFLVSSPPPALAPKAEFSTQFQLTRGFDQYKLGQALMLGSDMVWVLNSNAFTEAHTLNYSPESTCYHQSYQGSLAQVCEVETSRHLESPSAIPLVSDSFNLTIPRPQYPPLPFRDVIFTPIYRFHSLHQTFFSRTSASHLTLNLKLNFPIAMYAPRYYWKPIHLVVVGHREIRPLNGAREVAIPFKLTFALTLDSGLPDGAIVLDN